MKASSMFLSVPFLYSLLSFAQVNPATTDTRNFIKTSVATAPVTDPNVLIKASLKEVKQSATYFDGLDRPEQSVVK